jgi:hypothetical protein
MKEIERGTKKLKDCLTSKIMGASMESLQIRETFNKNSDGCSFVG